MKLDIGYRLYVYPGEENENVVLSMGDFGGPIATARRAMHELSCHDASMTETKSIVCIVTPAGVHYELRPAN